MLSVLYSPFRQMTPYTAFRGTEKQTFWCAFKADSEPRGLTVDIIAELFGVMQ